MKVRIENNKNIQTMEQKDIDIYEILKNEEYGTELYTPKCGRVWHSGMANDKDSAKAIWTEDEAGREHFFDKNGKIYKEGEILLFPSKQMRDWSKFFKKGDVLICYEGKKPYYTIFDGFENNTYRAFKGKFAHDCYEDKWYQNEGNLSTSTFHKLNRADSEIYVTKIEERFGGKLNRETLEIEKPEFKDGDIVSLEIRYIDSEDVIVETYIVHGDYHNGENLNFYAGYRDNITDKVIYNSFVRPDKTSVRKELLRYATKEEKQQLFSALSKENKVWDAEKRQVVGLKPAFEIGKLYVFREEDEDGELTIIGELIAKNESEDTLTFGNQYEIENEKFVTDQTFDLRISVNKELREATEGECCTFQEAYTLWEKSKEKKSKEQSAFKTFDKVLVMDEEENEWIPALFVRDRGEGANFRYEALSIHSGKTSGFSCCITFEGNEYLAFTSDPF
jgi:hypothetical protein